MNIYGCWSTPGESAPVLQATLPAVGLGQVLGVAPGCGVGDSPGGHSVLSPRSPLVTVGHHRLASQQGLWVTEAVTSQPRCHAPLTSPRGV